MFLTYRYILSLVPAVLGVSAADAQNLLANPSFEDVNICTEFNAPCTPSAWESVAPESVKLDYMYHHFEGAGNNLIRLVYVSPERLYNYAQTQLLCRLEKGRTYRVTVVGWKDGNTPPEIDLRFDTTWTFRETGSMMTDLKPTLQLKAGDVVKEDKKRTVFTLQKEFTAGDHFNCLVLGTFVNRGHSPVKVYNYIDSIGISPVSGEGPLCASAGKTEDSLYAQHRRHSVPAKFYEDKEAMRRRLNERNLQCITLLVKDHTIFTAAGKAQNPETATRLDSIIRVYDAAMGMKVRITGHAFREGTFNYNKIVAEVNAKKVMDMLIYRNGFSYEDITVESKGNTQPRYDTATAEGRERNNFLELEFCMPRPAGEETIITATPMQQPDTLVIPDVLFRFNSSELNAGLYGVLDSLLRKIPGNEPVQLRLVGHTDNRGDEEFNQELSRRRALAVADYLKIRGWGNYIRHVSGEGEKRPVAPNGTEEGRQRNRRVEIIIYKGTG